MGCGSTAFSSELSVCRKCYFFPLMVLWCCDIPKGKVISCVKHELSVRRPCINFMATRKYIKELPAERPVELLENK